MDYLLGTSNEELRRLAKQHEIWSPEAMALWQRAGFKAGDHLLDAGSGPGFASLDLAHLVGAGGSVTGVEISAKYCNHFTNLAESKNLKHMRVINSSLEDLNIENLFDGMYSRWVFCFLPDVELVIKNLSKLIKIGGRVAITDYHAPDYSLFPDTTSFNVFLAAMIESWNQVGGNLNIQRVMPKLLIENGFKILSQTPYCKVARPGETFWRWPEEFYKLYGPLMVEKKLLSQTELDHFWKDWESLKELNYAHLKTPTLIDIVAEKI